MARFIFCLVIYGLSLVFPVVGYGQDATSGSWDDPMMRLFLEDMEEGDAVEGMRSIAWRLIDQTRSWSRSIRENVMEREAKAIARAILLPILITEFSLAGLRIIRGSSLSDQLARLTGLTFIAILSLTGVPQSLILGATHTLSDSGRNLGALVLRAGKAWNHTEEDPKFRELYNASLPAPGSPGEEAVRSSFEPVYYWSAWLGSPPSRSELLDDVPVDDERFAYKFAPHILMQRIWRQDMSAQALEDDTGRETTFAGSPVDYLQRSGQAFLQTFFVLGLFLLCLTIASIQAGAYLAILFPAISILLGAVVSLDLVVALGYAILPLIYFKAFDRLWAHYFVTLVGLSLIPFFYYICSALGFIFSTTIFEVLFPLLPDTDSFARLLASVYLGAAHTLTSSLHASLPQLWGLDPGQAASMAEGLIFLGKMLAGSLILASFISIGAAFSAMAPLLALRWRYGFSADQVFERIAGGVGGVRDAFASGVGSLYRGAFEQGSRLMAGMRMRS